DRWRLATGRPGAATRPGSDGRTRSGPPPSRAGRRGRRARRRRRCPRGAGRPPPGGGSAPGGPRGLLSSARWRPRVRRADGAGAVPREATLPDERLVLDAMGFQGRRPEPLLPVGLVVGEVALEPPHLGVALEGQHVGGDP